MLPVRPVARNIQMIVAWQIFLPNLNRDGEIMTQNVKMECKLGNQFSIQNDMVWGVQAMDGDNARNMRQSFRLNISANISTDRSGKDRA